MALCFVGLASEELHSFFKPAFGRTPSLPHLNFWVLLDMEFPKKHWIKKLRGEPQAASQSVQHRISDSTWPWSPKLPATSLRGFEAGFALRALQQAATRCGPKIPSNAEQIGGVRASATKSQIAQWLEKMFFASTGLGSPPLCVVLPLLICRKQRFLQQAASQSLQQRVSDSA